MLDLFLGWFVIAVPFLVAVGATLLALKVPDQRHYWKFVTGAILVGLAFSILTYWQQVRVARQAADDRGSAIQQTAKETTANVTAAVGSQFESTISSLTTQIAYLKGQLGEQEKQVPAIGKSNIVAGKGAIPVVVQNPPQPSDTAPEISGSSLHAAGVAGLGDNATQFIFTTNKVMNGGRLTIVCQGKINRGRSQISVTTMTMGGGQVVDDHTFRSDIESPNWEPGYPLVVTLYYDEPDVNPCKVYL
jgi:hypothetical protein